MSDNLIHIENVNKTYVVKGGDDVEVLKNVSLDISNNEFVCVVGPSGCGKTTLLNIVAGLETFNSGLVQMEGQNIIGPGPDRGVIFQQYALFPWMTVRKNIEYGMKYLNKYTAKEKYEISDKYIKMVNLVGFENFYPKELSGGMKQRVAIARAYAISPKVMLMDEPFGALDAQTRAQLQEDLLRTWEKEKTTCFFITHDVDEAVLLASKVVIMSSKPGQIKEIVKIDLPYPRNQATKLDDQFNVYKNHIWDIVYKMYLEVNK
ncbi:MAG: ABC transporter ATP-binding protein [Clostridia bacterium]|nr:ABC transporter ATP-binding protein [Clostridia bacterium]